MPVQLSLGEIDLCAKSDEVAIKADRRGLSCIIHAFNVVIFFRISHTNRTSPPSTKTNAALRHIALMHSLNHNN